MANVLAVFAHPDDEVLGCGGTLAKHVEAGDDTQIMILGRQELAIELVHAADTLGVKSITHGSRDDQRFDTVAFSSLVNDVYLYLRIDPDIIYTHHPGDLNLDHALTARAVLTAFRPKPGEKPRRIMACEIGSSTEWTFPQQFQPNWFEKLNRGHITKKERALACYASEVQPYPHPRSSTAVTTSAYYRGQQCGTHYAEAFQLLLRTTPLHE